MVGATLVANTFIPFPVKVTARHLSQVVWSTPAGRVVSQIAARGLFLGSTMCENKGEVLPSDCTHLGALAAVLLAIGPSTAAAPVSLSLRRVVAPPLPRPPVLLRDSQP